MNTCKNSVKQDGGRSCWSMRGTFEKLIPWLVEQGLISERKIMKYEEYKDVLKDGMWVRVLSETFYFGVNYQGQEFRINNINTLEKYRFNCINGPFMLDDSEFLILTEADGVTPYRQKNEFKVGDRVVGLGKFNNPYPVTCEGYIGIVTKCFPEMFAGEDMELDKKYYVKSKCFKKINVPAATDTVASWDKGINKMAQDTCVADCSPEEIPKKLSIMERLTASDDDKVLIKAGYLADGELTYKAKEVISALQFESFKTQLVEQAQMELDEAKE